MGFNSVFTKSYQNWKRYEQVLPLSLGISESNFWRFPIEPLISVTGANVITKRNVAKSIKRGTIKERWAENDYTIMIQGTFTHSDMKTYPADDVAQLKSFFESKSALYVKNELLQMLDIHRIVIESYDLPFSKGENVQNFTINAVSDDITELFIEIQNV